MNEVKNLRNTTNTNTLQDDNAGSTEMHCNPAIISCSLLVLKVPLNARGPCFNASVSDVAGSS